MYAPLHEGSRLGDASAAQEGHLAHLGQRAQRRSDEAPFIVVVDEDLYLIPHLCVLGQIPERQEDVLYPAVEVGAYGDEA